MADGDPSITARVADVQTRVAALHSRFAVPVWGAGSPSCGFDTISGVAAAGGTPPQAPPP